MWKTEVAWNLIVGSSFWENEGEALRLVTEGWPSCWLVELTEAISVHLNADITSLHVVLRGFSEGNIMDVSGIRDISLDSPHVSCCLHPSHSQDSLRGRSWWCQPRAVGAVFLVCLSDGAVSPEAGGPPSRHLLFEYIDCPVFNEKTYFLCVLKMIVIWIVIQVVEL